MKQYYILDIFNNLSGPHSKEEVEWRARRNPNFFVGGEENREWTPIDTVLEFFGIETMDEDGQPINRNYNATRVSERTLDELMGICKGIIADGVVHELEAEYLRKWLNKNKSEARKWPASVISERISDIFSDGVVTDEERADLGELLSKLTGEKPGLGTAERMATRLPINDPEPDVEFEERLFCLTGKFVMGPRKKVEKAITDKGGKTHRNPALKTDYLVIGTIASRDWLNTAHGLKINQARENRDERGAKTAIISEEQLTVFLD